MPLRPNMEPMEFLDIFRRKKWFIVITIILLMFAACVYCIVVRNQYKSSTTLLLIPQRIPEGYVRSTVSFSVQDLLPAIQQQLLSRTRLMKVIDELGLYKEMNKSTSSEDLVPYMWKQIEIKPAGSLKMIAPSKDAFILSFVHENPQTAMMVASKLASFFIDENLRQREQMSVGTSEFLEAQLNTTKAKLEEQEERVKRYKMKYMGELPQEMQANLNLMTRLQDQTRTNAESAARMQDRKVVLETQIGNLEMQISNIESMDKTGADPADSARPLWKDLVEKRKALRELSLKYTESYPTVVQLRREIDELKSKIAKIRKSGPQTGDDLEGENFPSQPEPPKAVAQREELSRLKKSLEDLNLEIAALKREKEENRRQMDSIQARVGRLPQREQEMVSLMRDYDNIKRSYDDLLSKRLEAKVSQNLEERLKGQQFQVLDPANLPVRPYRPDRMMVLGLAFLVAVAVGFGGSVGLEALDPTLREAKDFKFFFELPILASLPTIHDEQYVRREKLRRVALIVGIVTFLSGLTLFLVSFRENIRMMLNISGRI